MALEIALVRTQASTLGGNQDITDSRITDFSAAIVLCFGDTGAGSAADHARVSRGICNAAGDELCFSVTAPDNLTTASATASQCFSTNSTDRTVLIMLPTNPIGTSPVAAAHVVARATSGVANGVRINWDTTPDAAYEMLVILLGGLTNNAVWQVTEGVNAIGFQADLGVLLAFTGSLAAGAGSTANDYQANLGFFAKPASTIQQVSVGAEWNRAATTDADMILNTALVGATVSSGAVLSTISIDSIGATSFSASSPTGSMPSNMALIVELPTPKPSFGCAVEVLPSGTGNTAFTALGFGPGVTLGQATLLAASDSLTDGSTAAVDALFAFTATEAFAGATREQENVTVGGASPTDTSSLFDTKAMVAQTHTGTTAISATLTSIDPTGFTLNFATATAGRAIVLGIALPQAIRVLPETVEVSDSRVVLLARYAVTSETVLVTDSALLLEQAATSLEESPRGLISSGGVARGDIVAGGATAGLIVSSPG